MFHSRGATVQTEVCVAVVNHTVEPVIARVVLTEKPVESFA
jgi:hypothetical protein